MLRARYAETHDYVQRSLFWETLMGELPAFLHFLVTWQIPEALRDGRFGIKTWHHPQLLADLDALAPETRLLALIDQELFSEGEIGNGIQVATSRKDWQGTAEQLEQVLFGSDFRVEAQRLLTFPTATGTYLGRLANKRPDRVKKNRSGDSRRWIISRPASVPDTAAA